MAIVFDDEQEPVKKSRIVFDDEPQAKEGFLDTVNRVTGKVSTALQPVGEAIGRVVTDPAYAYSPPALGLKAQGLFTSTFNKGGEMAAEKLAGVGANPYLAAAAGTAVQLVPEVAAAYIPVEAPFRLPSVKPILNKAGTALQEVAQTRGAKALGYTKRFLKDPKKAALARSDAQVLLDENVIRPISTARGMSEANSALSEKAGSEIGSFLKTADDGGTFFDPNAAIQELNAARPQFKGGAYDKIHGKIDNVIETVKAHGEQPMGWQEANDLKGVIQDLANWQSNKDATLLDKKLAGIFRETLDTSLEGAARQSGQVPAYKQFQRNKKIYGATSRAEDALFNRISSEEGNKTLSLTDMVAAAPSFASGGPGVAASILGVKRVAERFGNQATAVVADRLSKKLLSSPNSFGRFSGPLQQALGRGTFAETHRALLTAEPEYQALIAQMEGSGGTRPLFGRAKQKAPNLEVISPTTPARILDETGAREYLKKAGNDKNLARKLAKEDGWRIP